MINKNIIKKFLNGEVPYKQFDKYYSNLAKKLQNSLTKPKGSLGKLEEYAIWMAGWRKRKKSQQLIIFSALSLLEIME